MTLIELGNRVPDGAIYASKYVKCDICNQEFFLHNIKYYPFCKVGLKHTSELQQQKALEKLLGVEFIGDYVLTREYFKLYGNIDIPSEIKNIEDCNKINDFETITIPKNILDRQVDTMKVLVNFVSNLTNIARVDVKHLMIIENQLRIRDERLKEKQ